MASIALDLGLRGATVGFALVVCALLFRERPLRTLTALRIALGAAAIAYAISTAPLFPSMTFGWNVPLVMLFTGSPVVFWLWGRAAFDNNFALRPHHMAIWALVAVLGASAHYGWTISPLMSATGSHLFALASIGLALLAVVQTLPVWRADLVAGRRRPLVAFLLATAAFVVVNATSSLAAIPWHSVSFSYALGIGVLAALGVWTSFPQFMGQRAPACAGVAARRTEIAPPAGLPAAARVSLQRLEYLMTVERAYRQEGLSIGFLAVKLGLPEHRLRTVINKELGHRNFSAFLNRYRLDEAKAALADPDQSDVPVLTIALDAGFQSITPFNRAFKKDTGLTPTEFRQLALSQSGIAGNAPNQPTV